jgi:hypothetical protein
MNSVRFNTILFAALVATFASDSDAWARPPRSRTASAVIESVDHTARALRLRRTKRSEPLTVIWNRRTRFLAGDQLGTALLLQEGEWANVSFHTPLFGERYATRIELVGSTSTKPHR